MYINSKYSSIEFQNKAGIRKYLGIILVILNPIPLGYIIESDRSIKSQFARHSSHLHDKNMT